jgi:hypothetical protein
MQSYAWSLRAAALIASLLSPLFCGLAHAQDMDGTWKLVMRKLPDGTTQVPPAILGAYTYHSGLRNLNVFWHTPDGKPASFSLISTYKMSGTDYTETLLFSAMNDGSGKPTTYNRGVIGDKDLAGATETTPVTREGGRVAFKLPFGEPSVVFEGDKFTATVKGQFVDYWERVP